MAFNEKKSTVGFSQKSLRRRFHHFLLSKRGESLSKSTLARPKRKLRASKPMSSPAKAAIRKVSFFVIAGGIFIGLIYVIFFSSFFTITKVALEKEGNAVSGTSVQPFLSKLKGKNILFVSTDQLIQELEQTFKNEILIVKINKSYPHKLTVKVNEYPAILNLRVVTPEKEQQLVINQIGYTILEDNSDENLPTLILRAPKVFASKSVVIDPEILEVISTAFVKFPEIFGMRANTGEWKKAERELHLKTEKDFTLWFDLTQPIDHQLSKLKRALAKLDIYNESLDYIDLRIAGTESEKVIFKRK